MGLGVSDFTWFPRLQDHKQESGYSHRRCWLGRASRGFGRDQWGGAPQQDSCALAPGTAELCEITTTAPSVGTPRRDPRPWQGGCLLARPLPGPSISGRSPPISPPEGSRSINGS